VKQTNFFVADIRTSARALFDAAIGQLTDEEVAVTVADYQHRRGYYILEV
jgi:hypothetical protein